MPIILSQMLEFCRWAGALIVLAVHSTNAFVSLSDIMTAPHAAPVYGWWFFASFELGHQAVISFFVMSGYLVGGGVLVNIRKEKAFLREYFIHRVARIYIVVAPALVLTFIADSLGRNLLPEPGYYDNALFQGHFGAAIFIANLANLQEIFFPFYGTNSPLWSLACEFWYYAIFPLLALPLARNYSALTRYSGFVLGAALLLAFGAASPWFRFGFLLWVLGALASLPRRPLIASRWVSVVLYVLAVIPIRLLVRGPQLAAHPWLQDLADIVGTLLFCNLMLTVRLSSEFGWDFLRPKFHRTLADFSFSLYSIHMPLLILFRAAADSLMGPAWARQNATPAHWATLAGVMALTIAIAYGFSRLTEAHTGAARRYLSGALPRLAPAAT
jgi:peptidoglycan/LPS O-acetylase OafA/YrhL